MNRLSTKLGSIFLLSLAYAPRAAAANDLGDGIKAAKPSSATGSAESLTDSFGNIANILIYLIGAISVIVLIYGGILYVISTGDQGRVKQAKDTIQYAIIGIVVAILAYAIVQFVTSSLLK